LASLLFGTACGSPNSGGTSNANGASVSVTQAAPAQVTVQVGGATQTLSLWPSCVEGQSLFQGSSADDAGGWSGIIDPTKAQVAQNADGSMSVTIDGMTATTSSSLASGPGGTWSGTIVVDGQSITVDATNLGILSTDGCSPNTVSTQGILLPVLIVVAIIILIIEYFGDDEAKVCQASFNKLVDSKACALATTGLAGCVPYIDWDGKIGFDGSFDLSKAMKVGLTVTAGGKCKVACACPPPASSTGTQPDGGTTPDGGTQPPRG